MTIRTRCAAVAAGLVGLLALGVVPAVAAAEGGPQWTVTSVSRPTNFKAGDASGEDSYKVTVTNTGGASSDGTPVAVTDELPTGLTLDPTGAAAENPLGGIQGLGPQAGFSCVLRTCTYTGVVIPDETLYFTFPVDVSATASALLTNVVRVSGGGASDASVGTPTVISDAEAGFGISPGGASTALSTTQAGAHPDLTTSIAFNTVAAGGALAEAPKDTTDDLPPGFAGDLVDTPSCPISEFTLQECPTNTQVGITTLSLRQQGHVSVLYLEPVYNLEPNPGEVAKLGFTPGSIFGVQGNVSVRPGDYGLRTSFEDINESEAELDSISLTIWGVPAEAIHDPLRFNHPAGSLGSFGSPSEESPAPFLTNPTLCGGEPLEATFTASSWGEPEDSVGAQMSFGPLVGCDRLRIEPSLTAEATTSNASAATGLDLDMSIPQTYNNAEGLSTSTLKQAVVTLPEGMTVNPSAGSGLQACSEAEYEAEGVQFASGVGCPSESKLGTVKIVTPSLKEEVTGSVYLAEPAPRGEAGKNPFGSLLALYIVARLPARGVLVKAAGEVQANPVTGQLVTTFDTTNVSTPHTGLPPLPFSLFTFSFRQGATSPLVTPAACGEYTVRAALTPYSDPGAAPIEPLIPAFPISSSFEGGVCPSGGTPPFNPGVSAGTLNNSAGSYSPLDIRVTRNDGEQEITGFSSVLPPGLTANLSGVPFCSEAAIALARTKTGAQEEAEPSCPVASEIGHTLVGAGVGSTLAWAPGKIYMAGPYEGAPFSVVSITSAKVGPFDLGTVVVHLPLDINPVTAAVSIPSGQPNQIPHIIKGIVIHVRDIRVYIDKANFTLNPTNCNPQTLSAGVIGGGTDPTTPGDDDPVTVSDPFQAANCANLKFAPKLAVTTSGKTSKADGASLSVKLTYPTGALGQDTNIKYVKVDLPRQLPSRLTTLQKACTAAQFAANPAGCPAASIVGHAKAVTPILPVPLEGPAYFVSHGGEAFPSLIMVLQGYGVTIDLVGTTFISNPPASITSSTFKTVPDQPIDSFELTLPEGKYSALGADIPEADFGNLCGQKLAMPTAFIGQNGLEIHQSTSIAITGCAKAKTKALTKAQKLANALKACKKRANSKRAACEKAARKKYRPVAKKQAKKK
jgi:uncharacterized repeat protein (TIGR01451 family)